MTSPSGSSSALTGPRSTGIASRPIETQLACMIANNYSQCESTSVGRHSHRTLKDAGSDRSSNRRRLRRGPRRTKQAAALNGRQSMVATRSIAEILPHGIVARALRAGVRIRKRRQGDIGCAAGHVSYNRCISFPQASAGPGRIHRNASRNNSKRILRYTTDTACAARPAQDPLRCSRSSLHPRRPCASRRQLRPKRLSAPAAGSPSRDVPLSSTSSSAGTKKRRVQPQCWRCANSRGRPRRPKRARKQLRQTKTCRKPGIRNAVHRQKQMQATTTAATSCCKRRTSSTGTCQGDNAQALGSHQRTKPNLRIKSE